MEDARKIKALTLQLSTYKEKINEANRPVVSAMLKLKVRLKN